MTSIKHLALAITLTFTSALVCVAQEQSKESANAQTTENASTIENAVGPIDGEGAVGKIPKFAGTNTIGSSIITESSGRVSISSPVAPVATLHVHGPALPSQTGNGTNATPLFQTSGGKGGNTTGADAGVQTAGAGASIFLMAGQGGDAPSGNLKGNGGSITLQPGGRGGGTGIGGASGNVLLAPNGVGRVIIGISKGIAAKLEVQNVNEEGIHSESNTGTGVHGKSTSGDGVYGQSTNGTGVHGSSSSGDAGLFDGKVQVYGTLTATGNVCSANISCASDARLKQGITALNYGLNQVLQLRPVSWHWKTEPQGKLQMGLVAQEVERVMPELILREADATKPLGLNYMGLLPVVVKAIQEQQKELESEEAEIKAIKVEKDAEIAALRAENQAIKARLDALEQALKKSAVSGRP